MRIAIPSANQLLCAHFGHCEEFAILDVDDAGTVTSQRTEVPPPHEPGVLPKWLHEQGVTHVIAGGMGSRAQSLFTNNNISVVVGAPMKTPAELASMYVTGTLVSGDNVCDH